MAKCKNPLFSLSASGSVSPALTFSRRNSGQQVRYQKKQKANNTGWARTDNQSLYRVICARWFAMSTAEKDVYNAQAMAEKLTMTGWNLFFKLAMADPKTYLGLCGYWGFNHDGQATVKDLSKNGNTGTLKPTWPSDVPAYIDSRNAKMRKALSFNGTTQYVEVADSPTVGLTGPHTIMVWMKSNVGQTTQGVISKNSAAWGYDFMLYFSLSGGDINYFLVNAAGTGDAVSRTMRWDDGIWHEYAFVFTGTSMYIYRDGIQIAFKNTALRDVRHTATPMWIARYAGSRMNCSQDEIRIYNRALGVTEIKKLYYSFF